MFAVIEDGSHQYRIRSGETLTVDLRSKANEGDPIQFDRVLLANAGLSSVIGHPTIEGACVEAVVVDPLVKGEKLEVQKVRRRKNSRRHTGHRQKHTVVQITGIVVPGLDVSEEEQETATPKTEVAAVSSEQPAETESEPKSDVDADSSAEPDQSE